MSPKPVMSESLSTKGFSNNTHARLGWVSHGRAVTALRLEDAQVVRRGLDTRVRCLVWTPRGPLPSK